ncbi:MAG: BON domain-containing protein [Vicinamibacterales bacterium]
MLQRLAALVGVAALTVACAQTDAGITTNVKSKMAADDTVKALEINVDTRNGVVTLTGDVDSAIVKERAVQIARTTDGVREVVDNITVTESAPTGGLFDRDGVDRGTGNIGDNDRQDRNEPITGDPGITSAVKAKLLADSTVSGLRINVDTENSVVTLTGDVKSKAEADRAVMLARNTDGVTRVVNHLKVAR